MSTVLEPDTRELSDEEAEAIAAALNDAEAAAQRLIAQMDRNLFLLRDCHIEAKTARDILTESNQKAPTNQATAR